MKSEKLKVKSERTAAEDSARLFERVRETLNSAKSNVARSVNQEMVAAYWRIGQAIVEDEQHGKERAGYGEQIIESLAWRLKAEGLKGFGRRNPAWMRGVLFEVSEFARAACRIELDALPPAAQSRIEPGASEFYETEAVEGFWSTRELERQINIKKRIRKALSDHSTVIF